MNDQAHRLSRWKRARAHLETMALRVVVWLMPKLPRRAVVGMGRTLGGLGYHFAGELRRVVLANLDVAFGDTKSPGEKRRIARASFQNASGTLLGLFWSPRLTAANLGQFIEVDPAGWEQVQAIAARGRGLIFVVLHYGDWELLGLATGLLGMPATLVTEDMRNTAAQEILSRLRARTGHQVVSQRFAAMKLLKALRHGGCIALLVDLNATRQGGGVWVDFFGLPVFNNALAAGLALRSGAALVGAVALPQPDGRCRLVYGPEITYTVTGDKAADLQAISQKCLRYCEQVVRERPDGWLWAYKRWRHSPTPDRKGYPFYTTFFGP